MKKKEERTGFMARFSDWLTAGVIGVIEGFDRLRFRGTLPKLYSPSVFAAYLCEQHVLLRNFDGWAQRITRKICDASEAIAAKAHRPVQYVPSCQQDKLKIAHDIAQRDGIEQGLIAVLKCVEPCQSYSPRRNPVTKDCEFRLELRKCLHFYFYFQHPAFGMMNVRLQSWVPFQMNISINGRHWLGRQLDQAGIEYRKRENAIVWVEDFEAAQKLLDQQVRMNWTNQLDAICRQVHPTAEEICRPLDLRYFWSLTDSEYATDLLFANPEDLARIYPSLVHHAISSFSSPDVMRFLGRKVPTTTGHVDGRFNGEVISDLKHRPEGVRVKHSVNGNSVKLYDKQGSVLRVETTILHCEEFKVFRKANSKEGSQETGKQWRSMRRSVADTPRRAQVSRASNQRYIQALGNTRNVIPLFEWTKNVCRSLVRNGKHYRAINPFAQPDASLLAAVNRGEFQINGFRNRDIQRLLFPCQAKLSKAEKRSRSARTGRLIRILRAHGLVAKVTHTHRYILTDKGRTTITALLAAHNANPQKLTDAAA